MESFLKRIILNNVQLKLFSLFFGYIFWSIISQNHTDDVWMEVPVSFYKTEQISNIEAPETTKVRLSGKRSYLSSLKMDKTAIHIDGRKLKEGDNKVVFKDNNIIIPEQIKVTGWAPRNIQIKVTKKL